jgi:hypothetical protein
MNDIHHSIPFDVIMAMQNALKRVSAAPYDLPLSSADRYDVNVAIGRASVHIDLIVQPINVPVSGIAEVGSDRSREVAAEEQALEREDKAHAAHDHWRGADLGAVIDGH